MNKIFTLVVAVLLMSFVPVANANDNVDYDWSIDENSGWEK